MKLLTHPTICYPIAGVTLSQYLSGRSTTEFAREIGVSPESVRLWMRGRVPRPKMMARIAKATNGQVTPADFYPIVA